MSEHCRHQGAAWPLVLLVTAATTLAGSIGLVLAAQSSAPARDAVAALDRQLATGAAHLTYDNATGYLRSVLAALRVPVESQVLVFSQTSAQFRMIAPDHPRAVYFRDTVAVGWVRGADALELAAYDPDRGYRFYTLRQSPASPPRLASQTSCLACHQAAETRNVPGPLVLSTFPMLDDPDSYASGTAVDHRTPYQERWGGWYVTGRAVPTHHMGNRPVLMSAEQLQSATGPAPRLTSVAGAFDSSAYLSQCSDVTALLALDHQARMTNLLTSLHAATRAGSVPKDIVSDVVDYALFLGEPPLASPVEGGCGYREWFEAQGPFDRQGRSLRQLDLQRRLLKYRLSYMIYSEAFSALPAAAKDAVFARLWAVLDGEETASRGQALPRAERAALVEILRQTMPDLPGYFVSPSR